MKLPLLISVPHAGTRVPLEVSDICVLSERQIAEDGDEGSADIYALMEDVTVHVTTDIARAIVDLNRAPDDVRADGVVKLHTIHMVPVYSRRLTKAEIADLLELYYHPYHRRLSEAGSNVILGIDCHTMTAVGPLVGPNPGEERPAICLSNADGTCPQNWLESMAGCLRTAFDLDVSINSPFKGGYIIRTHAPELPWMQIELSRAHFASQAEKRRNLLRAFSAWCGRMS